MLFKLIIAAGVLYALYLLVLKPRSAAPRMPEDEARAILGVDAQQGQLRTDSAAKKLIDSIVGAINNGANFDSMV
ncbi:MAG TPA: hypothetical protein VN029_05295, partial [Sphingomonas sp.]|nr:hypothetical protein [Sphingomonas sp.]